MTEEDELKHLLRSALPPAASRSPSRDLWPSLVSRTHARAAWSRSWLDLSVAAGVAVALLMFPQWLLMLAYHL